MWSRLQRALSGLDPSFHTVESLKWFVDRKIEDAESCVEINTRPLMAMTRIFADRMRKQVCVCGIR